MTKSTISIWKDALIAVALISTIPNLILFLIPIESKNVNQLYFGINIQHIFLSFASGWSCFFFFNNVIQLVDWVNLIHTGGLLGDVFIHALPHLLLSDSVIFGVIIYKLFII